MKFKPLKLGLTLGILCATIALLATFYPEITKAISGASHGESLRALMENIYPCYKYGTWYAPILAALWGFLDGLIFGLLFGGLYNLLAKK